MKKALLSLTLVFACLLTGCARGNETLSQSDSAADSIAHGDSESELESTDQNAQGESFVDNIDIGYFDCNGTLYSYDSLSSYFSGKRGAELLELMAEMPESTFDDYLTAENQISAPDFSYNETADAMEIRINETNLKPLLDKEYSLYTFSFNGRKYAAAVFKYSAADYLASKYCKAGVTTADLDGADIFYTMIFTQFSTNVSVYPQLMYGGNVYSTFLSAPFNFISIDGHNYQFIDAENSTDAYVNLDEIRESAEYIGKSTIGEKTYTRDTETGEWSPFAPTNELEITDIDKELDLYLIDENHIIGIEQEQVQDTDTDGNAITYEVYYPFVHFDTAEEENESMLNFFAYKTW